MDRAYENALDMLSQGYFGIIGPVGSEITRNLTHLALETSTPFFTPFSGMY